MQQRHLSDVTISPFFVRREKGFRRECDIFWENRLISLQPAV
jgi:hypothetical protein